MSAAPGRPKQARVPAGGSAVREATSVGVVAARDSILQRLRNASVGAPAPLPDVSGWYTARRRHEDTAQRVTRLRSALEAVKTEVHDCSRADWAQALLRLAVAKGLRNLLIGTNTPHGAERVVSADCGCMLNITGRAAKQDELAGLSSPTLPGEHIASFLWRRTTEASS